MQQITSYNQLFTNISEHPEYPYIITDFLVVNDEKVDLWCSQRTSSLLKIGEPKHRLLRGKVAYDTPEMKRIGREIKRKLQKDLRGTGFEVHSNLRFRF